MQFFNVIISIPERFSDFIFQCLLSVLITFAFQILHHVHKLLKIHFPITVLVERVHHLRDLFIGNCIPEGAEHFQKLWLGNIPVLVVIETVEKVPHHRFFIVFVTSSGTVISRRPVVLRTAGRVVVTTAIALFFGWRLIVTSGLIVTRHFRRAVPCVRFNEVFVLQFRRCCAYFHGCHR